MPAYRQRTREWKNSNDKLKIANTRAAYLPLSADAKQSVAEKRSHLRHNAATVLERLKSQNDIVQLTEDSSWARLLASIEGLTEKLGASSTGRTVTANLGSKDHKVPPVAAVGHSQQPLQSRHSKPNFQ
ncbi:hypothetical protein LP415_06635 [Polaromonas sp. P1(28)-8]|nr:hypothetical protein LP415_06635 [Polaromonas sp. P1(28)-8]